MPSPPETCTIECYCGQAWVGARLAAAQIVTCAACGRSLFIFPAAPWGESPANENTALVRPRLTGKDWAKLVIATSLTTLLLIGFVLAFLEMRRPAPLPENNSPPDIREQVAQAEEWLGQGQFRRAAKLFKQIDGYRSALSNEEHLLAQQWRREAEILADLIHEPLDALIEHAQAGAEAEWLEEFTARYRGKSILLDADFFPGEGEWKAVFALDRAGNGQLSLQGVTLFDRLPERKRQRLIIGLRLASVRLEPPGPSWMIRFEPEGVFITHAAAAAHACPPLGDEDAQELLARQRVWAAP